MTWATTKDNCEIYYEDKGAGPVLVFVSGFMGIADIWHNQTKELLDYRCIEHDNRGYGRSSKPESPDSYSIEQHAEDLKSVLDDAKVNGPVVLVTHSIGSAIGTAFTLAHPDMVAGIVYTAGNAYGNQFVKAGVTEKALVEGVSGPSASYRFFKNFGLNEEIAVEASKWPLHGFKGNAKALINYNPGKKEYSTISVPVLIIHGDKDIVNRLDPFATELKELIPNAKLEVLNGVNHFPQVEAPDEVTSLIKEHLQFSYN
ncbi:alpha/beta hydrolase fold protein [Wallemia mellicola]|nr:alpha/beta hydrolase fold protein [Wallemia mellicola]